MERLIFSLVLVFTARIIYQLSGKGRRQVAKIPEGMGILCPPPGKRYLLYAMGTVAFVTVLFFGVLYIMDGAPEAARPMWGLCTAAVIVLLAVTIFGGHVMAKECMYFNGEEFRVEKAFRKPQTFRWNEIRRVDGGFDRAESLYLLDGTKVLTADNSMVNYKLFCTMLKKKKCPEKVTEYYRTQAYDQPQKCVLRYGGEYYALAVMGILMLLVYAALFLSADGGDILQAMLSSNPSQWFSIWFAPLSGVAGIVGLFVLCGTSIRYSQEKMVIRYPLRKKRELYWRDWREIERMELVPAKENGWKALRLYTEERVYRFPLARLSRGRDGFMTELFKMAERYQIPCEVTEK